jgi:hypothetical protein
MDYHPLLIKQQKFQVQHLQERPDPSPVLNRVGALVYYHLVD